MIDISAAIRYEDSTHTYWLDGVRVPSITQCMKPACFDAFDFVNDAVLATAAANGSALHRMVELYEERGDFDLGWASSEAEADLMVDLLSDLDAYLDFKAKTGFVVTRSEQIVASRKYKFAGRLDLTGMFPGESTSNILEIKRTATPPRSAGIQTAGQEIALRETFDIKDSVQIKRWVLHLRHGQHKLIPHTSKADKATFLACRTVTNWREA